MEEIVLRVILAALLGLSWQSRPGMAGCEEYGQIPGMAKLQGETGAEGQAYDPAPAAASGVRSVFSAYVVGGLDFMDDGSYDYYMEAEAESGASGEKPAPDDGEDRFPQIYFRFMGLDLTDYIKEGGEERESHYHKAFCSDEFYMEYPYDWYVGSADASPLTFVPEWEEEASGEFIHDWAEFFDENLEGSISQVEAWVQDGGIDQYLEEVLGKPVPEEYEYVAREKDSDWLLIYDLKNGEAEAAEIIIWCNLGKMNVRNWEVELTVDPERDYGRILVFRERKAYDFSSAEAVREYMETGAFLYDLLGAALEQNVEDKVISIEKGSFTTLCHEFVCADIGIRDTDHPEQLLRQASVYIPVTKPYQSNWVVVFESFPGSRQAKGVANQEVRERVMSTFVVLPYCHQVKAGENLSVIAAYYGEEPDLAYEIAAYRPNHIRKPDLIYPGQEVEIPLRVFFRRVHH